MPFLEHGAAELLGAMLAANRLELSGDEAIIGRTENLLIVVGTPVDEFLRPSMTVFEETVAQVEPHVRSGALVVLRSTVFPGTGLPN
jgi:UDP-N-acetyl-D-mannosaminuronic acid dehydrogenase